MCRYLHDADVVGAVQLALLHHLLLESGQVPLQVLPLAGVLLLQVGVQPCDLHLVGQTVLSERGETGEKGVGAGAGAGREAELTMSARCTYFSKRPRTFSFSCRGSWMYATQLCRSVLNRLTSASRSRSCNQRCLLLAPTGLSRGRGCRLMVAERGSRHHIWDLGTDTWMGTRPGGGGTKTLVHPA